MVMLVTWQRALPSLSRVRVRECQHRSMASASDQTITGKIPVPPLQVTAYTAKLPKKRKSAEERKDAKRKKDLQRAKTRINIGNNHTRWRTLRDRLGLTLDLQLAQLLLDTYERKASLSPHSEDFHVVCVEELEEDKEPPLDERDEKPVITCLTQKSTTHGLLSGSVLKCPACGFVLKVQNGNDPQQPQSIEVTLEMEQTEEPVSGADQSEGESEEEEEEEEEESEGSGVEQKNGDEDSDDDWTPQPRPRSEKNKKKAVEGEEGEEDEEEESGDEAEPKQKKQLCTECGAFYVKRHKCDNKTKPFVCNVCGRRFVTEGALKIHSNLHSESHEFHCKYCNISFRTKKDKLAHELIHLKQKDPFKCPDCPLTFPSFRKRAAHKKQHPDKNKCTICGIDFTDEQNFMRHVAVHTGERPFKCFVCDMSFKQVSHLKSHMRLHTGERPYRCKHCPKAFNHNVSLKSHVQKYHSEEEEEERKVKEEGGETAGKSRGYRPTGRPKGRPKRNADGTKESPGRKILKTEQDTDDYESEVDSTWSQE